MVRSVNTLPKIIGILWCRISNLRTFFWDKHLTALWGLSFFHTFFCASFSMLSTRQVQWLHNWTQSNSALQALINRFFYGRWAQGKLSERFITFRTQFVGYVTWRLYQHLRLKSLKASEFEYICVRSYHFVVQWLGDVGTGMSPC